MHPTFYRSASPQPSASRDQAARVATAAMYQPPYVTGQDMMRMHAMGAPGFGFATHPHPLPVGAQFFQAPAGYHISSPNELLQNSPRNSIDASRVGSPSRRRPSVLTEYSSERDRDRYVGGVSPSDSRSPNAQTHPRHLQGPSPNHPRSASPRQPSHNSGGGYSSNRSEYREFRSDVVDQRHVIAGHKKFRGAEMVHQDVHEPVYRSTSSLKPELRQQDFVNRPAPLEAISPPVSDDYNEFDRMLQQVQYELKTAEKNFNECEMSIHQLEVELKQTELRKEEHENARRSHVENAKPDSPENCAIGDLARRIISENRRIAEAEHRATAKKCPLTFAGDPNAIYHHPSDMLDVIQVVRDFQKQRPGIILRLKKDRQAKQIRERYLKERYKQLSQAYLSRLEKTEANARKKAREAKMREYYERQFPEIKKIREEKSRDNSRPGMRLKSDFESDFSGTEDMPQDLEKYYRGAVLVPMLLDAKDRSRHFYDRNRLVENCASDYKESIVNPFWTQEEEDIFREKYLQRPKDFGFISSALKRKSVQDCVQYYYLTKGKEKYKQMVKKQKALRIRRGPNKRIQSSDEPPSPNKLSTYMSSTSIRLASMDVRNDLEDVRAITLTVVCPARKCQARRRSIKRLFKAPSDVSNFTEVCRRLELPETATSCCKYCVYFLERRLGLKKWSSIEIEALRMGLNTHGPNWNLISKSIPSKRLKDCIQYFRRHSAEFQLPSDAVHPPTLPVFDDDYSPFSVSSSSEDEEINENRNGTDVPMIRKNSGVRRNHSDDSNATLSADEVDEPPEVKPQFLTKIRNAQNLSDSIHPNLLPPLELRQQQRSEASSPSGTRLAVTSSAPACVRDLIHSAIEKNLDKPLGLSDDFRKRLESAGKFGEWKHELDQPCGPRNSEDSGNQRGIQLMPNRGTQPNPKSPNRLDVAQSQSPHRRDASPHQSDMSKLRQPGQISQQRPIPVPQQQNYQFSTRQNLVTDFATSRQIHAEQVAHAPADGRQSHYGESHHQQQQQPPQQMDPRFMSFYPQYVFANAGQVYGPMMTPESYMDLVAAGLVAPVQALAGLPPRTMVTPQRSIMLGTGRPAGSDENLPAPADRDSASRLQTLAANRGLLPEAGQSHGLDKRKPEVITLDESQNRDRSPNINMNNTDMRFHPAARHLMKSETTEEEPNPNLTAGSLINVIITRQISSTAYGNEPGTSTTSQSTSKTSTNSNREEALSAAAHKPFTLGEHIEQIIANDFSRKDSSQTSGALGLPVSMYQSFPVRNDAGNNWKRNRLRIGETLQSPPLAQMYSKPPTTSVASTVEYEPISPPEKEGSDSEDEASKTNS